MSTIQQLQWSSMTTAVNEMKSPNQFLRKLLFGSHEPKPTSTIEIDVLVKARETAPFVLENGEAVMVAGHSETFQSVKAPNIRIKRPFTPSELLENRRPGSVIFAGFDDINTAIEQHIARDLQVMSDLITNTEEYLCSLAIQGLITYQVADAANFQITFPRPAANNVILATFWNDPDPQLPALEADFLSVKRILSQAVGLAPTDCILGQEASAAFVTVMKKQFPYGLVTGGMNYGSVDFTQQFSEDGAIFLGMFAGVRCWEYSRSVSVNGVSTSMIRSKYAEFVCATPGAENVLYYGAIPDDEALQGRSWQGERFSKSWTQPDPSARIALLHSRPLPVTRRPGSLLSMKVVSG